MQYSIGLQDPYSDSVRWMIILAVLSAAAAGILIICFINRKQYKKQIREVPVPVRNNVQAQPQPYNIMAETLQQLDAIERAYRSGQITVRETCCRISFLVRSYISGMTGGDAVCRTLSEIQHWNRPELTRLLQKLYGAQFSAVSAADAGEYFRDARKLVQTWR